MYRSTKRHPFLLLFWENKQWGLNNCAKLTTISQLPIAITTHLGAWCEFYLGGGAATTGVTEITSNTISCKVMNTNGSALGASSKHCWFLIAQ